MSEQPNRQNNMGRIITIGIVVVVLLGVAAFGYIYVTGGSGEASQVISAPTLVVEQPAGSAEAAAPTSGIAAEQDPSLSDELTVFDIIPEESEVRFSLDEVLAGNPVRVVGVTNQVAGQIGVNFADPEESQVGVIRINVRTLATDSELRNRAIRGQILQSSDDRFEFAQFEPTSLREFEPTEIIMGEPINFVMMGNLTLRDVTQEVRFSVLVIPVDGNRVEGTAAGAVMRADFGLEIPNVPNVANVSDIVMLEIDFVALLSTGAATE